MPAFNPTIQTDDLPHNWTFNHTQGTNFCRLEAPDTGHIVLQACNDYYAVSPMRPATSGNATTITDNDYIRTYDSLDDAISYAIDQATRLAHTTS